MVSLRGGEITSCRTARPAPAAHWEPPPQREGSSRPVSRVLYGPCLRRNVAAIHLGPRSHAASSNQPGWQERRTLRLAARAIPIRSCSRWGLPCHRCCQRRGALLPHLFTLTEAGFSGIFSVALSLGLPPAAVSRHRFFVEPGLSSRFAPRGRPADWMPLDRRLGRAGQCLRQIKTCLEYCNVNNRDVRFITFLPQSRNQCGEVAFNACDGRPNVKSFAGQRRLKGRRPCVR